MYTWGGWVRPVAFVPSPKSQRQVSGFPVEVSMKVTVSGAIPSGGARVKRAVTGTITVT